MIVELLPSASESPVELHFLTSFLINDAVALDAGALGLLDPQRQAGIADVVLTHAHADHVATLPMFVENAWREDRPLTVYGHAHTVDAVRTHIFNDCIWPDLVGRESLVRLVAVQPEEPFTVGGLRFLPVEVVHTVPSLGYVVSGDSGSVAFTGDTGPTERIWAVAADQADLQAIFVEASFPNAMEQHALRTGHLTPKLLQAELAKFNHTAPPIVSQIKPKYREQVIRELAQQDPGMRVGAGAERFQF